jgi:hypothetical protein
MRFLSDEWFQAAGGDKPTASDHLRLGYVVSGGPDGTIEYRIILPSGSIDRLVDQTDVVFAMDYETARNIHAGRENPQECVLDGRIDVQGDPQQLITHADALEALPAVFAHLSGLADA